MTFLFIEDDEDDVLLLEHALKKAGINERKQFLANGRRAVEFLERGTSASSNRSPFLIFLDLNMPEMNGFDFLQWLRGNEAYQTTPVFILSTSENPRDIKRAYELQANAYLVKGNTLGELIAMLTSAHRFWATYNRFDRR